MSNKKKIIPELRFPEFVNDGEWIKQELENSLDYLQPTPYLVQSTKYDERYEIPVLTAGKSFILGYTDEKEGVFNKNLPVIIFDDFTTASKFVDFPFKVKSSAMKILLAKSDVNIKFVYESMQTLNYEVGVHKRHWISVFSKIRIPLPKLLEQQKIVDCLTSLDKLIESHSKKLVVLKDHKKGLMQNLFPKNGVKVPKFRFPEFANDGEWEEKALGKIAKFSSGGTPSKSNPAFWGGTIPWISASSMYNINISQSDLMITEHAVKSGARIVEEGTILILVRGSMLFNRIPIGVTTRNVSFNQDVKAICLSKGYFTHYILYHLLAYENNIPIDKTGIGAGKIELEELKNLVLFIPKSINEQQKIASTLSNLDELIKTQTEEVEQLKAYKKGLMQSLFPNHES